MGQERRAAGAGTGGGGGGARLRRGPHRRGRPRPAAPMTTTTRHHTLTQTHKRDRLRLVAKILRKKENTRSEEEVAVLTRCKEEVKLAKHRMGAQQRRRDRDREIEDEEEELRGKCAALARAIRRAEHLVVYTGAGISTAADIPDYRGPNGIWTLLQQGKQIGKHDLTKSDPTLTHMALYQLYRERYLKFVVSQNCDGLHLRSGLPRRALSEVHGDMYVETCDSCKPPLQYWRLFDTTERTARYCHDTGRLCHKCAAPLRDTIVHFGERGVAKWPLNWPGALHHAARADVILCLGSSLKVLKRYPWLWAMDRPVKKRPDVYIVNLQWTPKDCVAALKINGRCDVVMKAVMEHLRLDIPAYRRRDDPIFAHATLLAPEEEHTTAQPTLVSESPNDGDDSDEDCPLNLLKRKMDVGAGGEPDERALDLSVAKMKSHARREALMEQRRRRVLRCLTRRQPKADGDESVRLNVTADSFSCTVKADKNGQPHSSNLKINASSNVEGISMEILAEEFERVHVEMKTDDNEIRRVSILLVNKSKTSPTKCNKFQQTDSECDVKRELSECDNLPALENYNTFKTSLRNYRKCKNNQYSDLEDKKFDIKSEISDEPLNLSGKLENSTTVPKVSCGAIPVRNPCILRVPKPILSLRLAHIEKQSQSEALDLRIGNRERAKQIKPLFSVPLDLQNEHCNVFKKKFQALTRVIMDNAISASRDELQYAYSGIHSIIHPVPFFVQYDFKSVFRSINFIRLGQKLLSNNNKVTVDCDDKRAIVPYEKPVETTRAKKKPNCQFCYDHYGSYACNFYSAHKWEERLNKYRKGKLLVCECCVSSESESDSEEENLSRLKSKAKEDEVTEDADDDLNKSVQISGNGVKISSDKEVTVQAGWFGKGFRKNRRRKR